MAKSTSPGQRVLLELEPIARAAAKDAIQVETAKLSQWQQDHVVFGANLGERWAVFEWYVPGERQRDARVIVKATVDRRTKEATVETHPATAVWPKRTLSLIGYSVVAPVIGAACFVLLAALLDLWRYGSWPPVDRLQTVAWFAWPMMQIMVLIFLYQAVSSVPTRLPDGKLLAVNRAWLKKRAPSEAS